MRDRGFGIIEMIAAVGLLAIVVMVVLQFAPMQIQGLRITRSSSCQSTAANFVSAVNFWDNSKEVRSYFPDTSNPVAPPLASDPLCAEAGDPSCDSESLIEKDVDGKITRMSPQLNLRNSYNWARNVYLSNRPQICSPGLRFDASNWTALDALLIRPLDRTSDVQSIVVRIQDSEGGCSDQPLPLRPDHRMSLKVLVDVTVSSPQGEANCSAETSVRNAFENVPAAFSTNGGASGLVIRNGAGEIIPQTLPQFQRCTCRRPYQPGMTCPEMHEVRMEVEANEPGLLFGCQFANAHISGLFNCGDISLPAQGGGLVTASAGFKVPPHSGGNSNPCQGPARAGMNCQSTAEFRWEGLAKATGTTDIVQFRFLALDTSGNSTTSDALSFVVRQPSCPPASSYCPGMTMPDGCGGTCPPGAAPPVCPNPQLFCPGTALVDQCGRACPSGSMPAGVGCPAGPIYDCGQPAPKDACGRDCPLTPPPSCPNPTGTCSGVPLGTNVCGQSCGVGSYDPPCPNPALFCMGRDLGTNACGRSCPRGTRIPNCPNPSTYCGTINIGCGVTCTGGTNCANPPCPGPGCSTLPVCPGSPGCPQTPNCPGSPSCHINPPCNNACPTNNCSPVTVCEGTPQERVCPATDGGQSEWLAVTCNTEEPRSFCGGPPVAPTRECRRSCTWMHPSSHYDGRGVCIEYLSSDGVAEISETPHGQTLTRPFRSYFDTQGYGPAVGEYSLICDNGVMQPAGARCRKGYEQ